MKNCNRCKVDLSPSDFNKSKHNKDGLQKECRNCQKERFKTYYENNDEVKTRIRNRHKDSQKRNKDYVNSLRLSCSQCNESHPGVLDFHHNTEKDLEISVAIFRGWSIKRLQSEIDKCTILCANCHRKHHWEERQ